MDVVHYIAARQTGKTQKAVELFWEYNDPNTYVVVANPNLKRHIKNRYGIPSQQILLPRATDFCSREIQTLIVDDYLTINKNNNEGFLRFMFPAMAINHGRIFLLSTPNKKYTEDEIIRNAELFLFDNHSN